MEVDCGPTQSYLFYNSIQPFYVLVFLRKSRYKKIDADLLIDREINQPPSTRDTLSLYIWDPSLTLHNTNMYSVGVHLNNNTVKRTSVVSVLLFATTLRIFVLANKNTETTLVPLKQEYFIALFVPVFCIYIGTIIRVLVRHLCA